VLIVRTVRNTEIHSVSRIQSFIVLRQAVLVVTAGIKEVKQLSESTFIT
jgi:hypothetical protein